MTKIKRNTIKMARNVAETARKFLLLGQCVPTVKQNAAKIRVKRLELDENLLMVCIYYVFTLLDNLEQIRLLF